MRHGRIGGGRTEPHLEVGDAIRILLANAGPHSLIAHLQTRTLDCISESLF